MKEDLQTLVERRDINLSQFLRNYIESILTEDENQEVLKYEPLGKVFVDDMDATISIRCHKTLKDLYRINDIQEECYYLITFFDPSGKKIVTTPFK